MGSPKMPPITPEEQEEMKKYWSTFATSGTATCTTNIACMSSHNVDSYKEYKPEYREHKPNLNKQGCEVKKKSWISKLYTSWTGWHK